MATNDLFSVGLTTHSSSESILDRPLREILLRAAAQPQSYRYLVSHLMHGTDAQHRDVELAASILELGGTGSYGTDLLHILELERSDVASVARFGHRVECASFHIYVAFDRAHVQDFELSAARNVVKPTRGISLWYCSLVNGAFNRYRDLRRALLHEWTPPAEVEPLMFNAFRILGELTPAESQLRNLLMHDRPRAFHELTRHLDIVVNQLKAAIELATDLETIGSDDPSSEDQAQLDALQAELLGKAGRPLSLTVAANELGVSRQALHKRIGLGTALGLMRGSELVVPDTQFVTKDGKPGIVEGLGAVVRMFDSSGAGRWSALQFLIEIDPNLKRTPFEALKDGERDEVVRAARAYLSLEQA